MELKNEPLIQKLIERGAEFGFDTEWVGEVTDEGGRRPIERPDRIRRIFVPLTPVEWVELCSREGEFYIGGCCGQTGYTQDILNAIFRDGGWIEARQAMDLIEIAGGHDGFEILTEEDETVLLEEESGWEKLYPLDKIFLCVAAATPRLQLTGLSEAEPKKHEDEDGVQALDKALGILRWGNFLATDATESGQHHGNSMMWIARAVPGLKLFNQFVEKTLAEPWKGFAIVNKDNEIQRNGYGYTIYSTQKAAKDMIALWGQRDDPEFDECDIKPVCISDNGIQVLD